MKLIKIQSVSDIITNSSSEAFMLDSTKLDKDDLEFFTNAINNNREGILYVDEYLKQNPCDIIEFVDLIGLTWDDVSKYEAKMKEDCDWWNIENINNFLSFHNKYLSDFAKYIVVYELNRYGAYTEELERCYDIGGVFDKAGRNESAVEDHSFCFS